MTEPSPTRLPLELDGFGVKLAGSRAFPGVRVSARIEPGEVTAFTGPVGSGKSLFFLALSGLVPPAFNLQGVARVGQDAPRVALVAQDPRWSVLPSDTLGSLLRAQSEQGITRGEALLPAVYLDAKRLRPLPFHALSASERVRVLLCLALAGTEDVIAFDGFGESLSPVEERATWALLHQEANQGRKVLIAARTLGPDVASGLRVIRLDESFPAQPALPLVRRAPVNPAPGGPEEPAPRAEKTPFALELKNVSATRALQSIDPSGRLLPIRGVTFWVRPGRSLALLGAAGSGKTVLLETIAGLSGRRVGRIQLDGTPLAPRAESRSKKERRALELVMEDARASLEQDRPLRSLFDAVRRDNPIRADHAEAWLERLHLPARLLDLTPDDLSEGELARLALARSLSSKPRVLLVDGPRNLGLSRNDAALLPVFQAENERGMASIFATSDPALARLLGEDIAVLHAGSIMEVGKAEEVLGAPLHPATVFLLGGARAAQFDPRQPPGGCPFVSDCVHRVLPKCSERTPLLSVLGGKKNGRRVACHYPLDQASAPPPPVEERDSVQSPAG
jgi:peptide/nickel transport system ATP-binding protein